MVGTDFYKLMYKWNLGIIVSFLQMSSWSDPTLSSLKSKFRSVRNMSDKFRISLISESSKIMESWLKDTYIIYAVTVEVTEFNNRKKSQKKPSISSQRSIMKQE